MRTCCLCAMAILPLLMSLVIALCGLKSSWLGLQVTIVGILLIAAIKQIKLFSYVMTATLIFTLLMLAYYVLKISWLGAYATIAMTLLISLLTSLVVFKIKPKYLKYFNTCWLILMFHFIAVEVARWMIYFIGKNISLSQVSEHNQNLIWDHALKSSSYALYIMVTMLILFVLHRCYKKHHHLENIKLILIATFFMIFPTHTGWLIAYTCGGFGGHCQRSLNVITPMILSINPLSISVSIVAAYFAYKTYCKLAYKINN